MSPSPRTPNSSFPIWLPTRGSCLARDVLKWSSQCESNPIQSIFTFFCIFVGRQFLGWFVASQTPAVQRTGLLPSIHWTIERILAAGMLPLYPIALYMDTPMMNFIVITAVSTHSYWGFDGVIKDYAFERRYGPALMPILRTLWKVIAGFGYGGLLYFNFNDVGFISAVKRLWAL
ncbi:unnamed protein product [Heterobilharzia americana]|nr:unnamed protein product [Heterobilharzia americana]